ncbi:biopolymer transporter ExbD [Sphingomonas donggukensis]|uniref:Biopolymer transporter ExbD n=1 Tax=Sphingomonas donggukensis TaxID=2949093 RepID=A0ABY4TQ47_9SPHN|nr:biopolymer transporter ExbD [Sphingomonas donggukensis]URW74520.1 biopolymer transporter ExbD [Sphingomonas donggukensis]
MRSVRTSEATEPFSAINITPMIDVLLVLIVMLILTIPVVAHKVPIDLPAPGPKAAPPEQPHRLGIAGDGALSWDGRTIADAQLKPLLEGLAREGSGVLHMQTDPLARYERFDQTLAEVKRANVTRLAFIGDAAMVDSLR